MGQGDRSRRATWTLLGALAVMLLVPSSALAHARVSAQDRAATHAFLEARLAYAQAIAADAPAIQSASEKVARRVEGECPGVLAGAPRRAGLLRLFEESRSSQTSARQRGEANRQQRQESSLEFELFALLGAPEFEIERPAAAAFATAVRALSWRDRALTEFEHASTAELEARGVGRAQSVCADMQSWVRSGYRTLSPATKAFVLELNAAARPLLGLYSRLIGRFGRDPLARYEGPAEKALVQEIRSVNLTRAASRKQLRTVETEIEQALGLRSKTEVEADERPAKGSVEIAQGKTAAGGSYTVWVEPPQKASGRAFFPCQPTVSVYEKREVGEQIVDVGNSSSGCLSRTHPQPPFVSCREGLLVIEAQTLPAARAVRLHLPRGVHVTSPVAVVPASLGGPIGFYYQVVRVGTPATLSLTELDASGRALRTVRLPRSEKCTRPSGFPRREEYDIASASVPGGPSFVIKGERTSYEGHAQSQLEVEVETEGLLGVLTLIGSDEVSEDSTARRAPFEARLKTGCQPHEYAILYGRLRDPADTVLARTPSGLVALRHARMPAELHLGATLAYIGLPAVPSEVIVRARGGRIVMRKDLSHRAREARETCEGEAEGSG